MANLEREKISTTYFYRVGYNRALGKYVVEKLMDDQHASYYDFYEISEEEYNMFGSFKLTKLVESLEPSSKRLLYSWKAGGDKTIKDKLYAK